MADKSKPWPGAKDWFWDPQNPSRTVRDGYNCRFMFWIYGNWKIKDMFNNSLKDVLGHAISVLENPDTDFIDADKAGPMRDQVQSFVAALIEEGPKKGDDTLEEMLTQNWMGQADKTRQKAMALKQKGFVLPYNHRGDGNFQARKDLFDSAKDDFHGQVGKILFQELLTTERKTKNEKERKAVDKAKKLGVLRALHDRFEPSETPRTPPEQRTRTPENGYCCQNGTCVPGKESDYCEQVSGGGCNYLSDECN